MIDQQQATSGFPFRKFEQKRSSFYRFQILRLLILMYK